MDAFLAVESDVDRLAFHEMRGHGYAPQLDDKEPITARPLVKGNSAGLSEC
jgi:hypothetical protein